MSERGKIPQLSDRDQHYFKNLQEDRTESARMLEKPSMEGIKETVIEKYTEQAHFVYELLQNADDAKATKVRFVLSRGGLIFAHNGTVHFSISDVNTEATDKEKGRLGHINAITSIAQTSKTESEIGKFGIGFKSVFQYSDCPEIFDPPFNFRIERFIVPVQLPTDHKDRKYDDNETLFYFPFNSLKKKPDDAYNEITTRLKELNDPLLFLKNIKRIGWKNDDLQWNYSKEEEVKGKANIVSSIYNENSQKFTTKFIVFEKEIPSPKNPQKLLKIDIAFRLSKDGKFIDSTRKFSPFCFFETHEPSDLQFIIQAPFVLNNSREGLKSKDTDNDFLLQNLGVLFSESLPAIRDLGYLSFNFFNLIPQPDFVSGSIILGKYPTFFTEAMKVLKSEQKLLPTNTGGHISINNAIISRGGKDFVELLGNKQLEDLFNKKDLQWLDPGISEKNEKIWRFFTDPKYLGIRHIRPEELGNLVTKNFFEKQSDKWMIKLYSFLLDTKYSDYLKNKPYIRISIPKSEIKEKDIDHVEPSDAYLPIENVSEKQFNDYFPVVKTPITQDKRAKQFLEKIGLTPPDEFAAVSQVMLPKYLKTPLIISDEVHKGDIEKIVRFIKVKRKDLINKGRLDGLQQQMEDIPFLYATTNDGKSELTCPQSIYLPHQYSGDPNLDLFFEKNPNTRFLDERYKNIPDITTLIEFLEISTKPKIITKKFQDYHTYKRGFTYDYTLDGLDFLCKNQYFTLSKSVYLWELLLLSQTDPDYEIEFFGILEYANDCCFKGANVGSDQKFSTIYKLLTENAWVPDKELKMHRPADLLEIHETFEKKSLEFNEQSQKLYKELKFFDNNSSWIDAIKEIVPENQISKIKMAMEIPEEFIIEAQNKYLESKQKKKITDSESGISIQFTDTKKELASFFNQPQVREPIDLPLGGTTVSNTDRRREYTADAIQHAQKNEPPVSDRISFSLIKRWEGKNPEVRTFLKHEYGGKCQICSSSFNQRNGDPYYEGLYMISHTKGAWLDRSGSVLCLCPTCCAKILHGSVSVDGDIVQSILDYHFKNEGGTGNFEIPIILCGKNEKLHFSEKHILDLQEILKVETKSDREGEII